MNLFGLVQGNGRTECRLMATPNPADLKNHSIKQKDRTDHACRHMATRAMDAVKTGADSGGARSTYGYMRRQSPYLQRRG